MTGFAAVGLASGVLLAGVSEPGARANPDVEPAAERTERSGPITVEARPERDAPDRNAPGNDGRQQPDAEQDTGIPQAPPPEPDWKRARRELVSAPWQFPKGEVPKVVYLTFDDGPAPTWTEKVLQVLRQHDAHATFFQLGENRSEYPRLVQKVLADGHTIGNHSTTHADLTRLPEKGMHRELDQSADSRCFRPPYGATNDTVDRVLDRHDMRSVLWDVDPQDWANQGADHVEDEVLTHVHPGAIVLLHDGGGERHQTVQALAEVLPELRSRGYEFHSLPC